jgi:hypothetical protein
VLLTAYRIARPVYRLRAGSGVDSYGDPVESWTTPDRYLLKGAILQDAKSEETGAILHSEKVLLVPGEPDLTEADRIEHDGDAWRVNGVPTTKTGLASRTFTVATLTRTENT